MEQILTVLSLLIPAFSLLISPQLLTVLLLPDKNPPLPSHDSQVALLIPPASFTRHLHRLTERSPTIAFLRSAASVTGLSPVTSSAQDDSISELLRFL